MIRTGQFKYVPFHKIDKMHADGWMMTADFRGTHHGYYAVLMWRCDCEA